jgi:hypothetical protein
MVCPSITLHLTVLCSVIDNMIRERLLIYKKNSKTALSRNVVRPLEYIRYKKGSQ